MKSSLSKIETIMKFISTLCATNCSSNSKLVSLQIQVSISDGKNIIQADHFPYSSSINVNCGLVSHYRSTKSGQVMEF